MPYRVEYASTNRAACKGSKPCNGTKIDKGDIRLGTVVEIQGNTSFQWRHFGCISTRQVTNMKSEMDQAADLDGYEDLREEDQAKFDRLWADGEVPEEEAMARGHDPLNDLPVADLRARAQAADVDPKGLAKDALVSAIRAAYGGAAPKKVVRDPLEDMTGADLQAKLAEAGLAKSGSKTVLVKRLREHLGPLEDDDGGEPGGEGGGAGGSGAPSKRKRTSKVKAESDVSGSDDDDDDVKPALKGKGKSKAAPAAKKDKAKPAAKGKRAKKEETPSESSAASSSEGSLEGDESSAEETEAEESSSSGSGSDDESDVKPGKKALAGKAGKARQATKQQGGRPLRVGRNAKKGVASDDDDEMADVKPRIRKGKPAPKAKKPASSSSEAESEPAPARKKKKVVKSESDDEDE